MREIEPEIVAEPVETGESQLVEKNGRKAVMVKQPHGGALNMAGGTRINRTKTP